jgi:L-threonylcarbamoyladenylate synthase
VQRPTTVIYEGAIGIASNVTAPDGSVGIRIVKDAFCKHLIKRFRKPIVSTSANISGAPSPRFFREVSEEVKMSADYIVRYRQDDETVSASSSVIKWNVDGSVTTLR